MRRIARGGRGALAAGRAGAGTGSDARPAAARPVFGAPPPAFVGDARQARSAAAGREVAGARVGGGERVVDRAEAVRVVGQLQVRPVPGALGACR
jgi:hypothetical protein